MAGMRIGVVGAGSSVSRSRAAGRAAAGRDGHRAREGASRSRCTRPGTTAASCTPGIYYAPGSLKARAVPARRRAAAGVLRRARAPVRRVRQARRRARRVRARRGCASSSGARPPTACPACAGSSGDELREIEPHAAGVAGAALAARPRSPTTAPSRAAFADDVAAAGGAVLLGPRCARSRRGRRRRASRPAGDELEFDRLVVCAGLQSDRVARLAGDEHEPRSCRSAASTSGSPPEREQLVRGLIYPVPDPPYPFLGVHFTRRVDGGVDVGPNAVLALAREGYRRRDVALARPRRDARAGRGFRQLARKHWRTGAHEMRGSLASSAFAAEARRYVPDLAAADVVPAPAGRPRPGASTPTAPSSTTSASAASGRHRRPQRPLARRDLEPGDRRAHRRRGASQLTSI